MSNFGIDLLLESQKQNIRSRNDVLVIIMHWLLCKNDLKNVGSGDDKNFSEDDRQSELLPEGWNTDGAAYTLRYTINKEIYIFHASVIGNTVLFNLLEAKTLVTVGLVLDASEIVIATTGRTLDDFVKDSSTLIKRMTEELVNPVLKKKPAQASVNSPSPIVQPTVPSPLYAIGIDDGRRDLLYDIGRGDLDPLGRGGGMLFNPRLPYRPGPMGPQGLFPNQPHGPLGPRYDPPNPFMRPNPDNDLFQPPGRRGPSGYDDMFM